MGEPLAVPSPHTEVDEVPVAEVSEPPGGAGHRGPAGTRLSSFIITRQPELSLARPEPS